MSQQFQSYTINALYPQSVDFILAQEGHKTDMQQLHDGLNHDKLILFQHHFHVLPHSILAVTYMKGLGYKPYLGEDHDPVTFTAREFDPETGLMHGKFMALHADNQHDLARKIIFPQKDVILYHQGEIAGYKRDTDFAYQACVMSFGQEPQLTAPADRNFYTRLRSVFGLK